MREITLSKLQDIMRECAGEDDSGLPLEDGADRLFTDLGYDSLALLETQSRIEREYGVKFPDDTFEQVTTPRELVEHVNGLVLDAA
ncbi:acyl carrier protein [Streptomyces sp. NPDC087659]|uniref:acyl carrier protein n=1 Tax=Streptomyces TaxID=1883 RepID=UPI0025B59FAB|nr:acyl carrier protein [Streptomyces sp. HUAS CB01]WJY50980.1 acyl carrier protein [Streptomyces sp. HUAS CB01]